MTIDTYLPEFVPPKGRGRAFALYQFIAFCIVPVVALLGWLLVPKRPFGVEGWRWVALIGAVGAMIAWWLRRGLPESPRWLALHGRENDAERVMTDLEARVARDTGVCAAAAGSADPRRRPAPARSAKSFGRPTESARWCCPSST